MKITGLKIRSEKRNTGIKDQSISKEDTTKIEDILKRIIMKFRTGKRNIHQDENISYSRHVQNIAKLAKLRDDMEKRSFSSLRIHHDGWYFSCEVKLNTFKYVLKTEFLTVWSLFDNL